MRTIPEVVEDIKSILNNIERTENCDGETLVDINELTDEILAISTYKPNKQNNADRIRSMSDEELLDFICSIETFDEGSVKTIDGGSALCSVTDVENWLQSEVENKSFS